MFHLKRDSNKKQSRFTGSFTLFTKRQSTRKSIVRKQKNVSELMQMVHERRNLGALKMCASFSIIQLLITM